VSVGRREQAIEAVGALDADLEALHQAQKHFQQAYRALAAMDLPGLRDELAREMVRIDQARQRLRTTLICLCLEEGVNINEVARLWGFSRQLAQRYAKQGTGPVATGNAGDSSLHL
jgi:hypothetical protein